MRVNVLGINDDNAFKLVSEIAKIVNLASYEPETDEEYLKGVKPKGYDWSQPLEDIYRAFEKTGVSKE